MPFSDTVGEMYSELWDALRSRDAKRATELFEDNATLFVEGMPDMQNGPLTGKAAIKAALKARFAAWEFQSANMLNSYRFEHVGDLAFGLSLFEATVLNEHNELMRPRYYGFGVFRRTPDYGWRIVLDISTRLRGLDELEEALEVVRSHAAAAGAAPPP